MAATRSGSPTAVASTRPTTTCRRSPCRAERTSGAAGSSAAIGASGWATGPHLHFEVWRGGSGAAATASTRWPTSSRGARSRSSPAADAGPSPCDNRGDVPRPRQDLDPRRRRRRRRRHVSPRGARPARRPRRRRRRPGRQHPAAGGSRPDDAPRLPLQAPLQGRARRQGAGREAPRQVRRGPGPGRAARDGRARRRHRRAPRRPRGHRASRPPSRAEGGAAWATSTSRPRRTGRPSTPRRASRARSAGSAWSSASSPTSGSLGSRTRASRRSSPP